MAQRNVQHRALAVSQGHSFVERHLHQLSSHSRRVGPRAGEVRLALSVRRRLPVVVDQPLHLRRSAAPVAPAWAQQLYVPQTGRAHGQYLRDLQRFAVAARVLAWAVRVPDRHGVAVRHRAALSCRRHHRLRLRLHHGGHPALRRRAIARPRYLRRVPWPDELQVLEETALSRRTYDRRDERAVSGRMRILIYGSKDFALTVAELVRHCGHEAAGFVDDFDKGQRIIGTLEEVTRSHPRSDFAFALAIGYSNLVERWRAWERLRAAGYA